MSRIDDLIDLIQTTNEVYFITAPGRVRTGFILVDDIVELALKSYLQVQALQRQVSCQIILEQANIIKSQHIGKLQELFVGRLSQDDLVKALNIAKTPSEAQLITELQRHTLPHWSI